jgi:hypothetical protein
MVLWDKAPYSRETWICDTVVGRYLIRRRYKGAREFVLMHEGQSTKHYGTVDQLKQIVERILASVR